MRKNLQHIKLDGKKLNQGEVEGQILTPKTQHPTPKEYLLYKTNILKRLTV